MQFLEEKRYIYCDTVAKCARILIRGAQMSPLLTNLSSKEINIMASPYNGYPTKGPHEPWGAKTTTYNPNQAEITITSLFPQFNRWAIGFDPLLDTFKQVSTSVKTGGYPPYNIYKNEDTYVLELAVAGFSKDDITITVKELQLTVEGRLEASKEEPIHKGIAARDFKQDFVLAEYVVVKGAELKDGLLRITLEQELPAELQPKVIKIK